MAAYYAMFHAARAALLAVDGSASTNHGRVVETFERYGEASGARRGRERLATTLPRPTSCGPRPTTATRI